jgi:uncharacterized protein YegJ (DUF2314 family)
MWSATDALEKRWPLGALHIKSLRYSAIGIPAGGTLMANDEPMFAFPDAASLLNATSKAKATLPHFRTAFSERRVKEAFYGVKIHFPRPDGEEGTHIWLRVNQLFADLYFCSPIELPTDFVGLKIGETKLATDDEIEDWMILDNGTLEGGFSLRAIREQLPKSKQVDFDSHMGVTQYADGIAE